jgi:general secretion pathway protein G
MNGIVFIKRNDGGWTFMETIIVISIVLILTSSVGYMAIRYIDRARVASARSQIDSFSVALESYYIDCGRYPSAEQGLAALWAKPTLEPVSDGWNGPYLYKDVPNDPWGNVYEYVTPGPNGLPYGVRSYGADGREGGENNDGDIYSWRD